MKMFIACSSLFLLTAFVAAGDPPKTFTGKAVRIADGDTITVLVKTTQQKVRLQGIDAPEKSQAFGTRSRQALGDKLIGKQVTVKWREHDKYGRILGQVYLGDRWINREMVAEGWAWHYRHFSANTELARAEVEARAAKRGLWHDPNPTPPWDFRKTEKPKVRR